MSDKLLQTTALSSSFSPVLPSEFYKAFRRNFGWVSLEELMGHKTEVWRSPSPNGPKEIIPAVATKAGVLVTPDEPKQRGTSYYYWIKHTDTSGKRK